MDILSAETWLKRISQHHHQTRESYHAMYSTWWDGIVTDPNLMMIPIDDHQVHRGDAVFEAFKVVNEKIYLLEEHLDRFESSSSSLSLKAPLKRKELKRTLQKTLQVSGLEDAVIRLFLGRGPGSFSANPYETIGNQLHIIVTELAPPAEEKIKHGVKAISSKIPPKEASMAKIKSCNYIYNVLMKKEAIDEDADFSVSLDSKGHFTEGSTENLFILNKDNFLIRPPLDQILAGTTMLKVFELAKQCSEIDKIKTTYFSREDLISAKEVMVAGTTIDILSVVNFDGQNIGEAKPGPVSKKLRDLLLSDQKA